MGYNYEFETFNPGLGGGLAIGAAGAVAALLLIIILVALAFSVLRYVLSSVGMYRIAKRRGIHHAWLAWVPVGNSWLLGSISDHYQYVVKKKVTKRRQVLLILHIIITAVSFVYGFLAGLLGLSGDATGAVGMVALIMIAYLILLGVAIAASVFCYIAYYDLFQSCKPGSAVLFLVLSVVFNVTLPFFVFACSGSDQGMPAKRPRQPEVPAEAVVDEIPVVEAEVVEDPEE